MKKSLMSLALLSLGLWSLSVADEWRVGVVGETEFLPYKGVKRDTTFYPLIHYDGDRFYIEGDEAGIYFLKTDEHQFSFGASYNWLSFTPKDSKDWQMKQLNKRQSSVMVNLDYTYITPYGGLSAEFNVDLLRRNKGTTFDLGYIGRVEAGPATFVPNLGATWYSGRYNNYYYGITEGEAQRSGLAHYQSSSGIQPYAELTMIYQPIPQWEVLLTGRYEHFNRKVKNSPMVNKRDSTLIKLGVLYQF